MKQDRADGHKTENSLGLLGGHLDRQLARLTQALGDCLDQANAVPREQDQYGHHRANEIGHAVTLAKTSAKLVASLAKLNGAFHHNIVVSHRVEAPGALPSPGEPHDDGEIALITPPPPKLSGSNG